MTIIMKKTPQMKIILNFQELDFEMNTQDSSNERSIEKNIEKDDSLVEFDLPKNQSSSIKVIGVGGGGSNAVNTCLSKEFKVWIL